MAQVFEGAGLRREEKGVGEGEPVKREAVNERRGTRGGKKESKRKKKHRTTKKGSDGEGTGESQGKKEKTVIEGKVDVRREGRPKERERRKMG